MRYAGNPLLLPAGAVTQNFIELRFHIVTLTKLRVIGKFNDVFLNPIRNRFTDHIHERTIQCDFPQWLHFRTLRDINLLAYAFDCLTFRLAKV